MTTPQPSRTIKTIITIALILPVAYLILSFANIFTFKPGLPVELSVREAFLSSSLVVKFQSKAAEALTLSATFQNPNQKKSAQINLTPKKNKEYGFLQGWGFQPGDKIELTHPDYKTLTYTIPESKS